MYWFREGVSLDILSLIPFSLLILVGGWSLVSHAFKLKSRERLIAGAGVGLGVYLFLANIIGQWISPPLAFWIAASLVFLLGMLVAVRESRPFLELKDLKAWRQVFAWILLAVFISWMASGLGIFDDRKNTAITSLIAAGDLPLHFYMNSDYQFAYHYGFQLFSGSLMSVGGFLPWSAFDVAKSIVAALGIMLAFLVGWRLTHKPFGGWVFAFMLTFASGARWLLHFLPQRILLELNQSLEMWGSGLYTSSEIFTALGDYWSIGGGSPFPIPFAYVNGILQPFILGLQAGPGALMRVLFLLFILLLTRQKGGWRPFVILVMLFSIFALAAEAAYGLFLIGLLGVGLIVRGWKIDAPWKLDLRTASLALIASVPFAVFQGGTISGMFLSLVQNFMSGVPSANVGLSDFGFRWPPAIISSHLGELRLSQPYHVLVAIAEMGAGLVAAPLVIWRSKRWLQRGKFTLASLTLSAIAGLLLPIFIRYSFDRDVTRFTLLALLIWILLAIPILFQIWRKSSQLWVHTSIIAWGIVACFAGVIVFGSLITSIPYVLLPEEIMRADGEMASRVWNRLDPESEVLGAHPWRTVAVTGRLIRSTTPDYQELIEWEQLLENVSLPRYQQAGYGYVYLTPSWWNRMTDVEQGEFNKSCAKLVDQVLDGETGSWSRRLYDIRSCKE
jgi:hypothetical protein